MYNYVTGDGACQRGGALGSHSKNIAKVSVITRMIHS